MRLCSCKHFSKKTMNRSSKKSFCVKMFANNHEPFIHITNCSHSGISLVAVKFSQVKIYVDSLHTHLVYRSFHMNAIINGNRIRETNLASSVFSPPRKSVTFLAKLDKNYLHAMCATANRWCSEIFRVS